MIPSAFTARFGHGPTAPDFGLRRMHSLPALLQPTDSLDAAARPGRRAQEVGRRIVSLELQPPAQRRLTEALQGAPLGHTAEETIYLQHFALFGRSIVEASESRGPLRLPPVFADNPVGWLLLCLQRADALPERAIECLELISVSLVPDGVEPEAATQPAHVMAMLSHELRVWRDKRTLVGPCASIETTARGLAAITPIIRAGNPAGGPERKAAVECMAWLAWALREVQSLRTREPLGDGLIALTALMHATCGLSRIVTKVQAGTVARIAQWAVSELQSWAPFEEALAPLPLGLAAQAGRLRAARATLLAAYQTYLCSMQPFYGLLSAADRAWLAGFGQQILSRWRELEARAGTLEPAISHWLHGVAIERQEPPARLPHASPRPSLVVGAEPAYIEFCAQLEHVVQRCPTERRDFSFSKLSSSPVSSGKRGGSLAVDCSHQ